MPCTAEDTAVQNARIPNQVGSGEEGPHGVPEEKVGLVQESLGHAAAQGLDVVHHMLPAVLVPQVDHGTALDLGLSVAQVVVGYHSEAVGAQKPGKGFIALPVLCHPMGDLHYASYFPGYRRPLVDMDQRLSVAGGKVEFRYDLHDPLLRSFCFLSLKHYTIFPSKKQILIDTGRLRYHHAGLQLYLCG